MFTKTRQVRRERGHGAGLAAAPADDKARLLDALQRFARAARLADLGTTTFSGSLADLGMFIVEETEKWAKVVKFSGARPE